VVKDASVPMCRKISADNWQREKSVVVVVGHVFPSSSTWHCHWQDTRMVAGYPASGRIQ